MTNGLDQPGWIIADVWETIAKIRPDSDCIIQGRQRISWSEFDHRASAVAASLLRAGLQHQSKVAFFMRNSPEFLIGGFACLKVGMVPVNTNFRFRATEAASLWNDADAECVVFTDDLTSVVAATRHAVPQVKAWVWIDKGSGSRPEWATPFQPANDVETRGEPVRAPWPRSPDDLILLYTGGTTGTPKGVMWRQDDVFAILNSSAAIRYLDADGINGVAETQLHDQRTRPRFVPCGPLIHGTGGFSSYAVLGTGGTVVLLEGQSFDPVELLDVVDRERISHVSIIGDAHGRPIADELDAQPARWSLTSLRLVTSAGMRLSEAVRARLLGHIPYALCVDILGSSEVPAVGVARSSASSLAPSATFAIGPGVRVVDEHDQSVAAGSGQVGVLVVKGRRPLGYYKDAARSAVLFRTIDGERWSVTGDLATVRADGSAVLLGRGSGVINTGGEKVYQHEVEESLLRQPGVVDAAVVGVPHDKLGQMVVAVVQPRPGVTIEPDGILRELRADLAGYKVPKRVHVVDTLGRNQSGKINYGELVRRVAELADGGQEAN